MRASWLVLMLIFLTLAGACSADDLRLDETSSTPSGRFATARPPEQRQPTAQLSGPDWQQLGPGVELRRVSAEDETGASDELVLVRVDPQQVRVRVAYDREDPGRVEEWARALDPLLVVNGGYFDEQGRATALVIHDGIAHGSSYEGFGGMFAVDSSGAVSIRSLIQQPYDPAEGLAQALQSTPMLLLDNGSVPAIKDDGDRARRTAIALDRQGRMLFIISSWPTFTLTGLGRWLQQSDLDLSVALNLDGGKSTGIYLNAGDQPLLIDSLVRLPAVIVVDAP